MRRAIALRARDDRGAYAILFAILIVALLIMVALAVDLSDARARVRDNQTRVDSATLAAGALLAEDPLAACHSAWVYIRTNTPGFPMGATSPCISGVDEDFSARYGDGGAGCDPGRAVEYRALNADPYEVVFTYPVTDALLLALSAEDRDVVPAFDGEHPCERFGITMISNQGSLFGGIVGGTGISAPATSVVRSFLSGGDTVIAALIVLEREACNVLTTSGQGFIDVLGSQGLNDDGVLVSTPGIIAVDSSATADKGCGNNKWAIDANNNRLNFIRAGDDPGTGEPGMIWAFGFHVGQIDCTTGNPNVCDPKDISEIPVRLSPTPIRARERITRAPVDHRYNCNADYGAFDIEPCPGAPTGSRVNIDDGAEDYIDRLRSDVGTTGMPLGSFAWWHEPMGAWRDYLTDPDVVNGAGDTLTGDRCSPSANRVIVPAGNWFVNCTGPQGFSPNNRVEFEGAPGQNNIVFQNGFNSGSQSQIAFNVTDAGLPFGDGGKCPDDTPGPAQPSGFIYVRNGDFSPGGQSSLIVCNSTVYLRTGNVDAVTSGDVFQWIAPFDGPLEDLAVWAEAPGRHRLGGDTSLDLEGVYFLPNADPFVYSGQSAQRQTKAQFWAGRLEASGQGGLTMAPDPRRAIPIFSPAFYLIR